MPPDLLLMYLRNARFSLSDFDFLVFVPEKGEFGMEDRLMMVMDEFYIPELRMGAKRMPGVFLLDSQDSSSSFGSESSSTDFEEQKFLSSGWGQMEDWIIKAHVMVYSNLLAISLKIFYEYLVILKKEKCQNRKKNSLIKKYVNNAYFKLGPRIPIDSTPLSDSFREVDPHSSPMVGYICLRQFFEAFRNIPDLYQIFDPGQGNSRSNLGGISREFQSVFNNPDILRQAGEIETLLVSNNTNNRTQSFLEKESHDLQKKILCERLLKASQNVISQDSSPVFQFMFLFNKAMEAYGVLVKEALGFEGLFLYATEVLEK